MIKITPKYTTDDIKKMILQKKQVILDAITLRLQRVGEACVSAARQGGSYTDRTGNLRSSIGYVILYNGAQLSDNFEGTRDGVKFARSAIAEIKEKYPTGFCLIVIAGMSYSLYVEARGYSVLTPFATEAAIELKNSLQKLIEKIK